MFQNEDDFARLADALDVDTEARPGHREELQRRVLSAFEASRLSRKTFRLRWPGHRRRMVQGRDARRWGGIMASRMFRYGTAAAVVAAAIIGVTFMSTSPNGSGEAWAIEQTVAALKDVKTIYQSGKTYLVGIGAAGPGRRPKQADKPLSFELWARRGNDGSRSGDLRFEVADGTVVVVQEKPACSYAYDPGEHTVRVHADTKIVTMTWFGAEFFAAVKAKSKDWQASYGKDEKTGRACVFVTCSQVGKADGRSRSWWWQFDMETKLPIRVKQWDNAKRDGTPGMIVEGIVYGQKLEQGLFAFKIPEGAKVINVPKPTTQPK